jgi:hypothetical protein
MISADVQPAQSLMIPQGAGAAAGSQALCSIQQQHQ